MGFIDNLKTGSKIMWEDAKMGWQKHGAQFLTLGGTLCMLISQIMSTKKGTSDEVQQAIAEANAVIDEIQNSPALPEPCADPKVVKKAERKKKFRLAKAKMKKIWTVGKHFAPHAVATGVGMGLIGGGLYKDTKDKNKLATGLAVVSAEFAAYRANVIAEQGEEKDLEYMTTKKVKNAKKVKMQDGTVIENTDENGEVTVPVDQNAFKLWCSPETCPGIYSDNLTMTIANLENIETTLARQLRMSAARNKNGIGTLVLNDMRREFGGTLSDGRKYDVPLGGIFGITLDKNDPESCKKYFHQVDLGWRADSDFMEGRKVGVWIIFPHDPEPIIGKINQSMTQVEQ